MFENELVKTTLIKKNKRAVNPAPTTSRSGHWGFRFGYPPRTHVSLPCSAKQGGLTNGALWCGVKTKIIFYAFLVLVILFLILLVFISINKSGEGQMQKGLTSSSSLNSSDSKAEIKPFAFQELTIPYLSSRNYESAMNELQINSTGVNYTSYLTSYTSDGLKINAQLTKPNEETPAGGFPAIIFVHGYILPSSYQTLSNYNSYVDYLSENGFVVFKIDLRGNGNSEGEAGGAYYSGDYVIDTLNAREALKTLDFVNPQKIGLWGHSMAGNVVFRSFVAGKNIPAVVIWAGAVYSYEDWQKYGLNDNSYRPPGTSSERQRRRQELFDTYGEFDPNSSFWRQVVPINYLDGVKGAVQLNHAVDDTVVNIGYSRDLNRILNDTLIPHEFNEYRNGGHNISGAAFNQSMQNTVRFFKEKL